MDADIFYKLGSSLTHHNICNDNITGRRRYRAMFGCTPLVSSITWNLIKNDLPQNATPNHLLWALFFLKAYNNEEINHAVFNVDEKTYRKWIWLVIYAISKLRIVCV